MRIPIGMIKDGEPIPAAIEEDYPEAHWNHRVIRRPEQSPCSESGYVYQIHEVHYSDNHIEGWTEDPVEPYGESLEELKQCISWMHAACDHPVLEEKIVEGKEILVEVIAPAAGLHRIHP